MTDRIVMLLSEAAEHEKLTEHDGIGLRSLAQCLGDDGRTELLSFDSEWLLMVGLVRCVRWFDPDLVAGWEPQKESIGFIMDRAAALWMQRGIELECDIRWEL